MRNWLAVGLMSGTSMDGVDAALVETDGGAHIHPVAFHFAPYGPQIQARLIEAMAYARTLGRRAHTHATLETEALLTDAHAEAVDALIAATGTRPELVGFHGQTLVHRPDLGWSWQAGDGARLAARLGLPVVSDFRAADMAAGGQGAPLLPVFHRALAAGVGEGTRQAILNLGGVGNITYLGENLGDWLSFDTGPANALVDDLVRRTTGAGWDEGGRLAASGRVEEAAVESLLAHPYFDLPPPKSLDRNGFSAVAVAHLGPADAAATLTAFSAAAVARALRWLPARPERILVCGGGRHNATMMRELGRRTGIAVAPVEAVGWNGDALEAEAFAYFAVRRLTGRPITFPETTGCREPTIGGEVHSPPEARRTAAA